jgi:2-polyprenyl-3-methyl-5-hydroxy-6-metoxy-1,4-benzoquinol methylase
MATPPIQIQQAFWNKWNASTREREVSEISVEQANVVLAWLERVGRRDMRLIDVGCGVGWLSGRLTRFGQVTGTDLSDEVLARAAHRAPDVRFIAGDFMSLDLARASYDVAISLEVLSHVADQRAFLSRIAELLVPGGYLMLATQNKPALLRNHIPLPRAGQLRRWVDRNELRQLLHPMFRVDQLFSITPRFNRGLLLRTINSNRMKRLANSAGLGSVLREVHRLEEKMWLGWTLMALAVKQQNSEVSRGNEK